MLINGYLDTVGKNFVEFLSFLLNAIQLVNEVKFPK